MTWLARAVMPVLLPVLLAVLSLVGACRGAAPLPGESPVRAPPPAPPFSCQEPSCLQRHPRMPDDGEWTCADRAGATLCVGGERAAGVAAAPPDPRWTCGPRRVGAPDLVGARVCIDLAPDFPDGRMAGWRCRTLYDPPVRRACERDPGAHTLADGCDAAHPCVDGSRCEAGRCVPAASPPDCWLDGDCPGRHCRLGNCGEARP